MNDFREFQKEYNDYLQHRLPYAEDYICHFGILGMKWGIRRYQNPDGSLTAAGKKRYNKYIDNPINKQFEDNIGKVSDKTIDAYDKENWHDADDSIVNLSKTEKIKDAIKKLPANYSTKDVEKLAKELSSGKFGTHIEKDKRASEHAIYEALKAKNEKKIVAEKHGFQSDNDMGGNFVNKTKDIVIDKDTSLNDNFMKKVEDFNKNYKEHDSIMRQAATKKMAERLGVSESQMKKVIDKTDRPWIYMNNNNDDISMTADYDLGDGSHVATVEYDPKTKKVYYVSMNG